MKELKVIFATLCMICAHAMAQDIPLSGIDPPEGPPIRRTIVQTPKVELTDGILTISGVSESETSRVDIFRDGVLVLSEVSASNMIVLPELQENVTYVLILTVNGRSWYGNFCVDI